MIQLHTKGHMTIAVGEEWQLNLLVLDKIEAHVPRLSELIEDYRRRHGSNVRAAIINAVLASEVRYLSREEVLYLAWLKADNDKRLRALDDDLKRRWLEKQRRQQKPVRARPHAKHPSAV